METVFAALPVMVRYMAPAESLPIVKLFNCAPLPFSVCVSLMQAVTVSLRPPYHLSVFAALLELFMTVNIPPHLLAALTYLKQVPVVEMANDPPPVITVAFEHRSLPAVGVFVITVAVGVRVMVGVLVGAVGVGVRVRVGVLVTPVGVIVGVGVRVGVFVATVAVGVLVGTVVPPQLGVLPEVSAPLT